MEIVKILSVDYSKMGAELDALRKNNIRLRKYVCFFKQFSSAADDTDM